jgi:hypothetical protein
MSGDYRKTLLNQNFSKIKKKFVLYLQKLRSLSNDLTDLFNACKTKTRNAHNQKRERAAVV